MIRYSRCFGRWFGQKLRTALRGKGSDTRPDRSPADAMLRARIEALEDLTDVLAMCLEQFTNRPLKPGSGAVPRRNTRAVSEQTVGTDEENTALPIDAINPPVRAAKKPTVH